MRKRMIWMAAAILLSGCAHMDNRNIDTEINSADEAVYVDDTESCGSNYGYEREQFRYVMNAETAWQKAYHDLLTEVRIESKMIRKHEEAYGGVSEVYYLYDIDKDDIPELMIRYGTCEADYYIDIYTYREGQAGYIGGTMAGHTAFYSWPQENAMLAFWGHMGYAFAEKVSIADGQIVIESFFEEDISQDMDAEYTEAEELVPGAVYLWGYRTELDLPLAEYEKITQKMQGYMPPEEKAPDDDAVKEQISRVINDNGMVYGVTADGFGGDTGYITFEEYCAPGKAARYNELPMQMKGCTWVDVNGDGQTEGILRLEEKPDPSGERSWREELTVILSLQDDVVYAYCLNYSDDDVLHENGVFETVYRETYGLSFDKDECYRYSTRY